MSESIATPTGPVDYRLLLPDGWYRIPLAPHDRERSVNALIERQFTGVDNAPQLKRQARKDLVEQAAQAYRNGGIELYLSFQLIGPLPLSASLLVTLGPTSSFEASSLDELAEQLAEEGGDAREVAKGELPAGTAVRTRERRQLEVGTGDDGVGTVGVDYYVPIPGVDFILLLSFSTPLEAVAEPMVGLFDAVAQSLTWLPADAGTADAGTADDTAVVNEAAPVGDRPGHATGADDTSDPRGAIRRQTV